MNYYVLTYNGSRIGESGEVLYSSYNAIIDSGHYDLSNACKECGTGAFLITNLPIRTPAKKEFYETLSGDLIISEHIFEELTNRNLSVSFLKRISHYRTGQLLPFYHLLADVTLPRMSSISKGIKTNNQCKSCNREGYFDEVIMSYDINVKTKNVQREYIFEGVNQQILNKSDLFNTWECFTHSWLDSQGDWRCHFAKPSLIVSENVKLVFEELKIRKAVFEKVIINGI